jgi:two-component system LytT family response regulator
MTKISCIIIEDEPLALERAKGYIEKIPFLNLQGSFDNALDGLSYLKSNHVDLLFLDINMDELSGIQLLENVQFKGDVIITTAYDQYALKGYELNVTDYLLKPYSFERFLQAIDKIEQKTPAKNSEQDYLFVKTENRLEKINLKEILFIEGMGDYRRIHLPTKRIMTLQTFTEFEKIIPSNIICRVHKSYMISIQQIESIERNRIKIQDHLIPISETYKSRLFELIKV